MSMDPSGGQRLDEIEDVLKAIILAINNLELVGSQRLDVLEADAITRLDTIERKIDMLGEVLATLIQRVDPEGA